MSEVFDFHTVKPGTFEIGPFTVHTERVAHPVERTASASSTAAGR